MRNILLTTTFSALLVSPAVAQNQEPRPSPAAKVSQVVGLTNITVEYSSPGVKKRKVFGDLVPYGQMWRTGANASTKLTVDKEVTIGGKKVAPGTYSILTIPTAKSWTFVINKNTDIGGNMDKYKQEEDVARVTAKPAVLRPSRERMTFIFSDFTNDGVDLDLEWDRVRVTLPIQVDTPSPEKKKS